MSRFDVRRGAHGIPYYLEVQSDFHAHISTRIAIPLIAVEKVTNPTSRLHVKVMVEEKPYYLVTPMMAALPVQALGKTVANLADQSADIVASIDFLLQGF